MKLTERDVKVLKAWNGDTLGRMPAPSADPKKVSLKEMISMMSRSSDARGIAV